MRRGQKNKGLKSSTGSITFYVFNICLLHEKNQQILLMFSDARIYFKIYMLRICGGWGGVFKKHLWYTDETFPW